MVCQIGSPHRHTFCISQAFAGVPLLLLVLVLVAALCGGCRRGRWRARACAWDTPPCAHPARCLRQIADLKATITGGPRQGRAQTLAEARA